MFDYIIVCEYIVQYMSFFCCAIVVVFVCVSLCVFVYVFGCEGMCMSVLIGLYIHIWLFSYVCVQVLGYVLVCV